MDAIGFGDLFKPMLGFGLGVLAFFIKARLDMRRERAAAYMEMYRAADELAVMLAQQPASLANHVADVQARAAESIAVFRRYLILLPASWEANIQQVSDDLYRPLLPALVEWDVSDVNRRAELRSETAPMLERSAAAMQRLKDDLRGRLGAVAP